MSDRTCPACGEVATTADAQWCEACGADFAGQHEAILGPPCVDCGADHSDIVEDYCGNCGRKQPVRFDHLVESLPGMAGVTDKGTRKHVNEDAFAIGASATGSHVVVVCDGVSSTTGSDVAARGAAIAARDVLVDSGIGMNPEAVFHESINRAQDVAATAPKTQGGDPASATIVAAVSEPDGPIRVAWLGDSRAYWLQRNTDGALRAEQLTHDHLWADEQIRSGAMESAEAMADPRAHSITRWLGADAPDIVPDVVTKQLDPMDAGWLLVCSDGLWKYAPSDDAFSDMLNAELGTDLGLHQDLEQCSEALVTYAVRSGGHDNITVVLSERPIPAD